MYLSWLTCYRFQRAMLHFYNLETMLLSVSMCLHVGNCHSFVSSQLCNMFTFVVAIKKYRQNWEVLTVIYISAFMYFLWVCVGVRGGVRKGGEGRWLLFVTLTWTCNLLAPSSYAMYSYFLYLHFDDVIIHWNAVIQKFLIYVWDGLINLVILLVEPYISYNLLTSKEFEIVLHIFTYARRRINFHAFSKKSICVLLGLEKCEYLLELFTLPKKWMPGIKRINLEQKIDLYLNSMAPANAC